MFFTKIKDFSRPGILFFKFKDFSRFQGPVGTMNIVDLPEILLSIALYHNLIQDQHLSHQASQLICPMTCDIQSQSV